MKKLFALLLTLVMCFALVACGVGGTDEEETLPPGVSSEKVDADDVTDIIEDLMKGDGSSEGSADLSATLAEIPDTFEDLLTALELDTQKNAYLAEIEGFLTALEGEITRIAIDVDGETFSLADVAGMDFLYAGVKDGAVLLKTKVPVQINGNAQTIDSNIYLTFDPETKTAHAVTEANGIIADHQVIPYGAIIDAYLAPDSEALLQVGMMYDMYVAEMKAALGNMESGSESEAFTLPEIGKDDLTSHGNNKFTLNNSYFEKAIRAALNENAETKEAIDELLEMLGLDIKLDFELYNKETIKNVSLSFSADVTAYFVSEWEDFNPENGTNRVIVDFVFSFNHEGDAELSLTIDVPEMLQIDVEYATDVTKKDGALVKSEMQMDISIKAEDAQIFEGFGFSGDSFDDRYVSPLAAESASRTEVSFSVRQTVDLSAIEKANATVCSMAYDLSSTTNGITTSSESEISLKTTEVGKYTFSVNLDSLRGDDEQNTFFALDFAIGTAEGFNVPQVILDAIAAH